MNKSVIALLAVVLATFSVAALAQDMRGFGLLALNTDEARADPGRSTLIETPDSGGGGGGSGARALRGGDGATPARVGEPAEDPLPAKIAPFDDPSQPAAPTPKRPTYRWQSLVPGAIK